MTVSSLSLSSSSHLCSRKQQEYAKRKSSTSRICCYYLQQHHIISLIWLMLLLLLADNYWCNNLFVFAEIVVEEARATTHKENFQQHSNNMKQFIQQQIQQQEQAIGNGRSSSNGGETIGKESTTTRSNNNSRNINADHTFNVLVVLLQWKNHRNGRTLIEPSAIEEMWNGNGIGDNYKGGSIANWTATNSHGKWKTHAAVIDTWIQMPETESYYADGNSGFPTFDNNDKLEGGIDYAMEQVDAMGIIDFYDFDQDNDGVLDSVMFLHTGYDAANGIGDCNDDRYTPNDMIHSLARNGYNINWRSSNGDHELGNYAIDSSYVGTCDFIINRIGVPVHEFMHTVGLPDLYDLDGRYDPSSNYVSGLGSYDIMASPYGQGNRLKHPGHLSPWSKLEMGWINPQEITQDGTYTVRASELYEDYYMISEPFPANGEYLIIENRQPLMFDELLWQPGGVVIYHVDDNVDDQDTRGFPGQNGWPENGNHYRVAVLQADGQYDLEKSVNDGNIDDFWSSGQSLGPGPNNHPNTDSYAFGNVVRTGITIENFVETQPGVWSFDVSGLGSGAPPPTPSPTNPPPPPPTKQPTKQPTKRPTSQPTKQPTKSPTPRPTTPSPTPQPTKQPTPQPTKRPTQQPIPSPTPQPTKQPTPQPTKRPTQQPIASPTQQPTKQPTPQPTKRPTQLPTPSPTSEPTKSFPTPDPPTLQPTLNPTIVDTQAPVILASPAPIIDGTGGSTPAPSGSPIVDTSSPVVVINTTVAPTLSSDGVGEEDANRSGVNVENETTEKKDNLGLVIGLSSLGAAIALGGLAYYLFANRLAAGSGAAAAAAAPPSSSSNNPLLMKPPVAAEKEVMDPTERFEQSVGLNESESSGLVLSSSSNNVSYSEVDGMEEDGTDESSSEVESNNNNEENNGQEEGTQESSPEALPSNNLGGPPPY